MSDEDVIRRRLLIDGDGTGDDRRLNILLKSILKWCDTPETSSESKITMDRMISQLTQCEYAFTKSRIAAKMNCAELQNYENVTKKISSDISKAKEDLTGAKLELKEAKIVRNNRLEYELLANAISEQPDRKQTDEKLSQLKQELQSLEGRSKELDNKLDLRRKQFYVMNESILQLRALLNENDAPKTDEPHLDVFDDEDMDILTQKPDDDK